MGERNLSKVFWSEALTGGLVLGIALFVWDLIGYWLNLPMAASKLASVVQFVLLIGGIVYFCRRIRAFRGASIGFPYGTAFGFIMAMMLFTGMIYGLGQYFLQVVIAPAYFNEVFEVTLWDSSLSEELIEQTLAMKQSMFMNNPVIYIFSGLFTMCLYGGLVGLIAAALMKRPADPFADNNNPENDYNPTF